MEEGTTRAVLTSVSPSGGTLQGLAVDLTTRESKAVSVGGREGEEGGEEHVLHILHMVHVCPGEALGV